MNFNLNALVMSVLCLSATQAHAFIEERLPYERPIQEASSMRVINSDGSYSDAKDISITLNQATNSHKPTTIELTVDGDRLLLKISKISKNSCNVVTYTASVTTEFPSTRGSDSTSVVMADWSQNRCGTITRVAGTWVANIKHVVSGGIAHFIEEANLEVAGEPQYLMQAQ